MSKRKRHKQRSPATRSEPASNPAELAAQGKRELAAGRFRDAVATFKSMSKLFPESSWQDGLTAAYRGRFAEFLGKGMATSAEQILSNLKPLVKPAEFTGMELKLLASGMGGERFANQAWQMLSLPDIDAAAKLVIAESLILSDDAPPPELADDAQVRTILAVRSGLQAVCRGDAGALTDALPHIARKSILAPWKLLLRALDAWYRYDDAAVRNNLSHLPSSLGLYRSIADTLEWLVAGAPANAEPQTADSFALTLCGLGGKATAIHKLQSLSVPSSMPKAFDFLHKTMPEFFLKSRGPGVWLGDWLLPHYRAAMLHHDVEPPFFLPAVDFIKSGEPCPNLLRFLIHGTNLLHYPFQYLIIDLINGIYAINQDDALCPEWGMFNLALLERITNILKSGDPGIVPHIPDTLFDCLRFAQTHLPDKPDPWLIRAQIMELLDSREESVAALRHIAEHFPTAVDIQLQAADFALSLDEPEAAMALMENLLRINPDDTGYLRQWNFAIRQCIRNAYMDASTTSHDRAHELLRQLHQRIASLKNPADFELGSHWLPLFELALATCHAAKTSGNDPHFKIPDAFAATPVFAKLLFGFELAMLEEEGITCAYNLRYQITCNATGQPERLTMAELELLLLFWASLSKPNPPHRFKMARKIWLVLIDLILIDSAAAIPAAQLPALLTPLRQAFEPSFAIDDDFDLFENLLLTLLKIDPLNPHLRLLLLHLYIDFNSIFEDQFARRLRQLLAIEAEAIARDDLECQRHIQELRGKLSHHALRNGETIANLTPLPDPALLTYAIKPKPKNKKKTATKAKKAAKKRPAAKKAAAKKAVAKKAVAKKSATREPAPDETYQLEFLL